MKQNRIAVISDYPDLEKAYKVWRKLYTTTHGTWPALFRTDGHKRRVIRCDKAAARFVRRVQKKFEIEAFKTKMFHRGETVVVWDDAQGK